jgi:hypothetical protein
MAELIATATTTGTGQLYVDPNSTNFSDWRDSTAVCAVYDTDPTLLRYTHDVSGYDYGGRVALTFDTSELGAGAVISSIVLTVVTDYIADGNNAKSYVTVTGSEHNDPLTTGDFDTFLDTELIDSGERKDLTGLGTGATTFTFNAAGIAAINKTGLTKIMLRMGYDVENTEVSGTCADGFRIYHPSNGTPSNRPILTIEYTTTPSPLPTHLRV